MARPALLIIDMVNDFVTGKLALQAASRIIPSINKLRESFRRHNLPVIHVTDSHIKGVDRELLLWGDHALRGSAGAEVVEDLKPRDGEYRVYKRRYSGFFDTELDLLLRELEVSTLVLTGVATDICVQHTAADAFFRGYNIVVVSDATATVDEESHKRALTYMKRIYGAKVMNVNEVIQRLERGEL
jgi:nicotinamidase-related amidase